MEKIKVKIGSVIICRCGYTTCKNQNLIVIGFNDYIDDISEPITLFPDGALEEVNEYKIIKE